MESRRPHPPRPKLAPDLVLWITIGVGLLSFVAGLINVFSVRDAAAVIARGEGESLLAALEDERRSLRRRMEAADLGAFAADHAHVTYLALLRPEGEPVVEWGESVFARRAERGRSLDRSGAVYRVTDRKAAPRGRPEGRPPAERAEPLGPVGPERPPGPRPAEPPPRRPGAPPEVSLQVEFEPVVARQLAARARLTLGLSVLIACLFLGAALLLRKLLNDREAAERRSFEEERLRSLGEMSGVLAHELRNPLASLKGHAQLLAEGLEGADGTRAERLVRDVGRLERLCVDLLEFVRSGPLDTREVTVSDVLQAARAATHDPGRIVIEAAGSLQWTLDPRRIEQTLTNLLRNALQTEPDGEVLLRAEVRGAHLVIEVLDRGPGIASEDRERVFQPFFTTRTEGTGLGLAVARRTAEMHGGHIHCSERNGGGTCFSIELPRNRGTEP